MGKYKLWLYFLVSVCFLCCGVIVGMYVQEQYFVKSNNSINARTAIAIVNQDLGVTYNDEKISYSEAFIGSLQGDFSVVSAKSAEVGFKNGTYGGVIIIPANMSEKVVSINAENPEQVLLSYSINKQLPAEKYIEVYENIASAQESMRSVLSYVYMASIFDEIHTGQDSVKVVTDNDLQDLQATEELMMTRFMEGLDIEDVPEIETDFYEYDLSEYLRLTSQFAENVSSIYDSEFSDATAAYNESADGMQKVLTDIKTELAEWSERTETYINTVEEALANDLQNISRTSKTLNDYYATLNVYNDNLNYYYESTVSFRYELLSYYQQLNVYHEQLKQYESYLETCVSNSEIVYDFIQIDVLTSNILEFDKSLIPDCIDGENIPNEWQLHNIEGFPQCPDITGMSNLLSNEVKSYDPNTFFSQESCNDLKNLSYKLERDLITVQNEVNALADQNYRKLEDLALSYQSYVTGMRSDVLSKYYEDSEELQIALDVFYEQKQANTIENSQEFASISELLPYSRKDGMINKPVVEFVVEPVGTQETVYESENISEDMFSDSTIPKLLFIVLAVCLTGVFIIFVTVWVAKIKKSKVDK